MPGPTEYVPVPAELLTQRPKTTVPTALTYGEALQLWVEDRKTIDALLLQLEKIGLLEPPVE